MSSDEERPVGLNRFDDDDDDHSDDEYDPAHDHQSSGEDEDEASDSLGVDQDMEEESENDDDNDEEGLQLDISGTVEMPPTSSSLVLTSIPHTQHWTQPPSSTIEHGIPS